jgi:hypothetical protein
MWFEFLLSSIDLKNITRVAFGASLGEFNLSWHRTAAVSGSKFKLATKSNPVQFGCGFTVKTRH